MLDLKQHIKILERKVNREKAARHQAESMVEELSFELYTLKNQLAIAKDQVAIIEPHSDLIGMVELKNLVEGYVRIDLRGNLVRVNETAKKILGIENLKSSFNVMHLIHRDDYGLASNAFETLLNSGKYTDFVVRIVVDDQIKHLKINGNLIYSDSGKPLGAEGILRDVTEETRNKERLFSVQSQLEAIVIHSPLGIVLALNRKAILSNPAFSKMLGFTADEVLKLKPEDIFPSEISTHFEKLITAVESGKKTSGESVLTMLTNYGHEITCKLRITRIPREDGQPPYILAIFQDISKEIAFQKELDEQRKQLETIIENSPIGIVFADRNKIIRTNQRFLNYIGYSATEISKLKVKDLTQGDYAEESERKLNAIRNREIDSYEFIKKYVRKDGSSFPARVKAQGIFDKNNEVQNIIGLIEDISQEVMAAEEKERILESLRQSNKELEEYAHVVSHDLKSPLRNISALTEWIKADLEEHLEGEAAMHFGMIEQTLIEMDRLIDGILNYSSIGKLQNNNEWVDLNEIFENSLAKLHVPPHFSIAKLNELPKVFCNPVRLGQVFTNLMSNAIKYNNKPLGILEIWAEENTKEISLHFKDNGKGIPPEGIEKVFKIFQTIESDKSSTGIGLSIVKKIIQSYGGEVSISSEINKFTTIHLKVPKR